MNSSDADKKLAEKRALVDTLVDTILLLDAQPLGARNLYLAFMDSKGVNSPAGSTVSERRNALAKQLSGLNSEEFAETEKKYFELANIERITSEEGKVEFKKINPQFGAGNSDFVEINPATATDRVNDEISRAKDLQHPRLAKMGKKADEIRNRLRNALDGSNSAAEQPLKTR